MARKQEKELGKLREQIDGIDDEILEALNRRARLVLEVAKIKHHMNARLYVPDREKDVIQRLQKQNPGPFPNDALKHLFRDIMSASLSLEEALRVAFLGPPATFTHLAGQRHFGSSVHFVPYGSVKEIFQAVDAGKADFGIVPIENSNEGIVSHTLDMFMDYDLKIHAEVMLEVSHNLLSKAGKAEDIKKIYSHPQAAAQCREWLEAHMPGIPVLEASSTSRAAEIAAENTDAAAIASELAARMYDLYFVEKHIEDSRKNVTRFLVIAGESPPPTGKDKTSIMFSVKDRPGALFDILTPYKRAGINLTKIESRPSKRKAWEYIFFVDMEGHVEDERVRRAIEEMKEGCLFLKVLGSYPCGE
ncbi:MAG: prephenate dehydratase [Nitrospirota bacterium]|jgi:chorismate mutase/prephenate dehydratase